MGPGQGTGTLVTEEALRYLYNEANEKDATERNVDTFWSHVLGHYFNFLHSRILVNPNPEDKPRVSTAFFVIENGQKQYLLYAKSHKAGTATPGRRVSAELEMTNFCVEKLRKNPGWGSVLAMVPFGTEAKVWKVNSDGNCEGIGGFYVDADSADTSDIRNMLEEIPNPWTF